MRRRMAKQRDKERQTLITTIVLDLAAQFQPLRRACCVEISPDKERLACRLSYSLGAPLTPMLRQLQRGRQGYVH